MRQIIYHVDVNNAFLSWEAVHRLSKGDISDLRDIPSAVGGDREKRHGVILAKSTPAKKYGIITGEPVVSALKKCPSLVIVPPNHELYQRCSDRLFALLEDKSPIVDRFSIDECFMDMSGMDKIIGDAVDAAYKLKDEVKEKFGFTVNIGVSENRLLAKMASDFSKPDKVHTLYVDEIKEKLWSKDAGFLFMVGKSTLSKLKSLGINTIGDIAKFDPDLLKYHLKSAGKTIWNYAHGIGFEDYERDAGKSVGNSTTTAYDIKDRETACKYILGLCENVGTRLRRTKLKAHVVCVNFKNNNFVSYSVQKKLDKGIDSTNEIYQQAVCLFDKGWKKDSIRLIGVTVSSLGHDDTVQLSILEDSGDYEKTSRLDNSIDRIREKYGNDVLQRAIFINNKEKL